MDLLLGIQIALWHLQNNDIPYDYWGQNFKFVTDEEQYNRIGLSRYACPTSTDYYISSDYFASQFANLQVIVKRCINTTENGNHCKTDAEIEDKMNNSRMQAAIISTYFDYDDYENPIKTYLGPMDVISLIPGFTKSLEVRVQENEASTADNIFYNIDFKNVKYYIANTRTFGIENVNVNDDNILVIYFNLDSTSDSYERVVFTCIDMFGFLGGLFDAWYFIGYIFVGYFNDKYYKQTILSKLYQVEQSDMTNEDLNKKNSQRMIRPKSSFTHGRHLSSQSMASK